MKISIGTSVRTARWEQKDVSLEWLRERLSAPAVRNVTREEFLKLGIDAQRDAKDVGGFVGGSLKDGVRGRGHVEARSLVTLDVDHPERLNLDNPAFKCIAYTTFKSTPDAPRWRILVPLSREITEAEYEPVARATAETFGPIGQVDPASFSAAQLMFWPAVPCDQAANYRMIERGEHVCNPDKLLALFKDWRNPAEWPRGENEPVPNKSGKLAEDPLTKPAPVGTFCRAYTMEEALALIPEAYVHGYDERWRFIPSDSQPGAVVYEHKFMYSNHVHDPAYHKLCNAFDIVRIHKFGALDEGSRTQDPTKLPSWGAMLDYMGADPRVQAQRIKDDGFKAEALAEAKEEAISGKDPDAWLGRLERDRAGTIKSNLKNLKVIVDCDPALQAIKFDEFARRFTVRGDLPWKRRPGPLWAESDLASLGMYLAEAYGLNSVSNVPAALLSACVEHRRVHPVKEYLDALKWDGKKRAETILIDCLGAEDTPYVRAVTRKFLLAARKRVYEPGCKFDQMLVLVGPQGIGKSELWRRLGKDWHSDNLFISDMQDKAGTEKLEGHWIVEVAELVGMRRTEVESIKGFLSRGSDNFRPAYARTTETFERQSVIVGTTNESSGFLRDTTGNRRFWIVCVDGTGKAPAQWGLDPDQVWAEVMTWNMKENLFLEGAVLQAAQVEQDKALEQDDRIGQIADWLSIDLPFDWEKRSLQDRLAFYEHADDPCTDEMRAPRKFVSVIEVWCELFGKDSADLDQTRSRAIAAMLIKLGWRRYTGNKTHTLRRGPYGGQKCFERTRAFKASTKEPARLEREEVIPF